MGLALRQADDWLPGGVLLLGVEGALGALITGTWTATCSFSPNSRASDALPSKERLYRS